MTKKEIDLKLQIINNLIALHSKQGCIERAMTEATIESLEEQLKLEEVFS